MKESKGNFSGPRELNLYYQVWQPEREARAVLQVVHGLGEHSGRYLNLVNYFVPRGYAICAFDLPGHGRSEGMREYVESFSEYTDSVGQYYQMVKGWFAAQPIFLLGHSLGGLITSRYLVDHPDQFEGAIFSAPGVKIPTLATPTTLRLASILSFFTPRLGLQGLDPTGLSRDALVVQAYREDPLVFHGKTSARLANEGLKTIQQLEGMLHKITLPLIALQGTADVVANAQSARYLYDRVCSEDKTIKIYEGLYHELFNEPEKDKVFKDIEDWLEVHL